MRWPQRIASPPKSTEDDDDMSDHGGYSERLLDHYRRPRNAGDLARPDVVVTVGSPQHGDVMRLSLRIADGRIAEAGFKVAELPLEAVQLVAEGGGAGDEVGAAVVGVLGLFGVGGLGEAGQFADLLGQGVAFRPDGLDFLEGATPLGVEGEDVVQGDVGGAAAGEATADLLGFLADKLDGEHGQNLEP